MVLKTGMLVGIVGTEDIGVLIQIRSSSNSCVIKLNNGTLKKNVPLDDVEEAKDMSDTKEKKSPIRLGGEATVKSPGKSPSKLASLSSDTRKVSEKLKTVLEVGDSVRARCNGGSRWFPGKIIRVHRDDTYDVEYSDGDIEKKMAAADVEVSSKLDKTPLGASSSRKKLDSVLFAVGDKVNARYNKGTKLYSGKIARVRSDGTYDITYDDGDLETRVPKDLIEPNPEVRKQDSGDEAPTRTKSKSSGFRVGQRVKARYKGGKKLFLGKVKRIHADGTYDIVYEDGDEEKRVKVENIEASADVKADSDEERKLAKGTTKKLTVGKKVKARYNKGKRLFPGKISKVRPDGTYDIDYDDGESETRVEANQIEYSDNEDMFADSDEDKKKNSTAKKKTGTWEVGDLVSAYYGKGKRLFPGKIAKVHMNGTYDIKYDDGDSEIRVEANLIEDADSGKPEKDKLVSTKSQASPRTGSKGSTKRSLRVGDLVKAKYKRGAKFFAGKITRERMDGTYDIKYEDGDVEERVEVDFIQRVDDVDERDKDDEKLKKKLKKSFEVGDVVKAPFQRGNKLFRGKISRVRSDGTYDITFDDGDKDTRVPADLIQPEEKRNTRDEEPTDSDQEISKTKPKKKSKSHSSSESSESDRAEQPSLKKGSRVTNRKAEDKKTRRVGIVRKVHSDGSCDVRYEDGDTSKRVSRKLLVSCSDSEDSDDHSAGKAKQRRSKGSSYRRNQHVMSNWRRSSKLSKPKKSEKWAKAVVLEKNSDGTYTIRYKDGVVEEDVPLEALKLSKKKQDDSDYDGSSSDQARRRRLKRGRTNGIGTESLFLLEQLAMSLFEEGALKKKPKLQLLRNGNDTSSSDSSSSSSTESASPSSKSSSKNSVDKVLKKLFDSSSIQNYRRMFKENDAKGSGKISRGRIIALVEEFMATSKPTKDSGHANRNITRSDENGSSVNVILTEWFATHDDLRIHRHFEFKTLMLAFAYAKSRLGKRRIEQSVATVLEGRFASYHENKRQLELWQQKLGYRLFETLQRHFHDHALPNMIPSRIRVSELSLIFEQIARQAMPNKPLDVYLQQHQLFPHHTLLLPEFVCCYYQLYGSEHSTSSRWTVAVELRPIAFVASCLFSNGDIVCRRHGDLVRRLSVGRTEAQQDLILRFREAFESLLSTEADSGKSQEEKLLETSQLSVFAAKVAPDPSLLEPAMTLLRKRSAVVSLVEVYGSCGFIIDELTSAPTIHNAIEKMRMRVDLAEVRRVIGLVRNICVKILRFPNNADYWRIRADSAAFQQKIGRFDGATSLLEAVGFVEYQKTHYELRGARNMDGKRSSTLEKSSLDALREKCVQLDGELSLIDGVECISSILERISKAQESEGTHFTLEECQTALKHLSLYVENVLKTPKDSRCWRIREANSTFQRQIGYLPHAMELMESIGFDLAQTSNGNVYALRGTGTSNVATKKSGQETQHAASLSNFAFTSVSSQMEWFLWRRKQEIDSLLEDEMSYLHDIVAHFSQATNSARIVAKDDTGPRRSDSSETREAALVKMYPYGTNAIDTFNKSSIQRHQLEMMKSTFSKLDVDQQGFLVETDFSRTNGPPSALQVWSRFDAFDISNDGKVDMADFVAALGPLLDHSYELITGKNGQQVVSSPGDDTDPTLCEAISLSVGDLRLGTSCAAATAALESLLSHLYSIIQEPGNSSLWLINDKMAICSKLLRFSAGRELLRLVGFREAAKPPNASTSEATTKNYELQPQRVRFKTSSSTSELPSSLDTGTLERIQTIASMLAGHFRGLKNPTVSDISAVSRAISTADRCSENWIRAVQLGVKCVTNIESEPNNPRYREINTATSTFTRIVGSAHGGLELLLSVGFRETDTGTLRIPSDVSLEELKARRLELEVGLGLLRLKSNVNEPLSTSSASQKLEQRQTVKQNLAGSGDSNGRPASGTASQQVETKRTMLQVAKGRPQVQTRHRSNRAIRASTAAQRLNQAKMLTKTNALHKQRPHSARAFNDPIEKEITSRR